MAEGATVIYHNPACGTSRNTLALIRAAGIEPEVVEYLTSPPARLVLKDLAARIGLSLRDLLREKGTPYAELGLDNPALGDDALLEAIAAHPILINRPIVVSPKGVKLCRPSDVVMDLLPSLPARRIDKEEGVPFLQDIAVDSQHAGLCDALRGAGLPTDDLAESGGRFFAYRSLDGETLGFGGFEGTGEHALIRSVVTLPAARSKGLGRNIVPLLLFRAQEAGARQAWLLTTSASGFFTRLGFQTVARANVPEAILATRQAASLCPASASIMTLRIGF